MIPGLYRTPFSNIDLVHLSFYNAQIEGKRLVTIDAALEHYRTLGAQQGLDPSPHFDTKFYLSGSADIRNTGTDPIEHYVNFGQYEGRRAVEVADPTWILTDRGRVLRNRCLAFVDRSSYLAQAGFLEEFDIDPVMHYFAFGHMAGFVVTPEFDPAFYVATNEDVREHQIEPLTHYLEYGYREGRQPRKDACWLRPPLSLVARAHLIRPHVDVGFCNVQQPEIMNTTIDMALHYILYGEQNHVRPNRQFDPRNVSKSFEGGGGRLTRLETHLLSTNAIPFYKFHDHEEMQPGDFAGVDIAALMPVREWDRIKATNGFDIQAICAYGGQRDIVFKEEEILASKPDKFEDKSDDAFVAYILALAVGKTLSCDIWDTVLRRDCYQDETKLRSARALWLKASAQNSEFAVLHPIDFMQMRRVAEAEASDSAFEFSFEDLAQTWLNYLPLPKAEYLPYITNLEKAIEKNATFADEGLQKILRKFKGRKIAISDFYLDALSLSQILEKNKIPPFDEIYVSCDRKATKRHGDLYDMVKWREAGNATKILHVGDRLEADVENARNHGLEAELYSHSLHQHRNATLGDAFSRHLEGDFSAHATQLSRIAGFNPQAQTCNIGAIALAFSGFIMKIIEDAFKVRVSEVFFFSREGVFFKELYDLATDLDVYDVKTYPTARLLYVSRRATFAATLPALSPEHLMRIWSQYSSQSMSALATSLNVDPRLWADAAERNGIDINELIEHPWKNAKVLNFLADPDLQHSSRNNIWGQRKNLLSYLSAAGFAPEQNIDRVIVDIGWRGTIQDNLALVSRGKIHGCYLGLRDFLNPQPRGGTKNGYLMDAPKGTVFQMGEVAALEFMSNSLGGSVIGYKDGVPVREIIKGEESCLKKMVVPLQKELLVLCKEIFAYAGRHGLVSDDLRPLSLLAVEQFMNNPEVRVANAFNALEHNETFGTGKVDNMQRSTALEAISSDESYKFHYLSDKDFSQRRWVNAYLNSSAFASTYNALSIEQRLSFSRPNGASPAPNLIRNTGHGISIFAPRPLRGSGGHRTIYNLAKALSRAGHKVGLFAESRGDQFDYLEQEVAGHNIRIFDHWFSGIIPDAAIATITHSSPYISKFFDTSIKKFYLVQDNEAEFNMMSDGYVVAENSFSVGHTHLCVGRWLPHMIRQRFGGNAIGVGLGVDNSVYRPLPKTERRKRIAVLYQPDKPRRMSQLVIEALLMLQRKHPDIEIVTYGSGFHPDLPFSFEHLGLVTDLSALNRLYNSAQVGLCVSLTNPSRIPYEMMAAGCVPVDVYRYNTLFDYDEGTAVLAYQSAQSIAAALEHLLTHEDELAERRKKGIELGQMRTLSWEMDVHVNALESVLRGEDFGDLPIPRPTYTGAAFVSEAENTKPIQLFLKWQRTLAEMEIGDRTKFISDGQPRMT